MPPKPPGTPEPDKSQDMGAGSAEDGRFREIADHLPVALYTTDADGYVTYFNQAAVRLVGREPELGRDRWCISHSLFRIDGSPLALDDCPLAIALREEREVRGVEALAERPDGTRVRFVPLPTPLYDMAGKLTGALNLMVDVNLGAQVGSAAASGRHHLAEDLEAAIAQKRLHLHYQPVFSAAGVLTGFEALARWIHPERGVVPPSEFIPAAEESGLILPLARELLLQACTEAASWKKPLRIAVNVSPLQFRHGDLPGLIDEVLVETGLEPERLELEITEGVMITDFDRTMLVLHRIKALGVRIALDDFGTGYSSLSYLHMFPLSTLKIDRSFVANLGVASEAAAITRAVIALGHALDIEVVAEGVETREQLDFLIDEGCNYAQGYMLGRPLPAEDYAELMERKG